jgi:hypothetical protein
VKYSFTFTVFIYLSLNSWGATTPSNMVINSNYYTFPNSQPGVRIQVNKICDIKSGTCTFSSNSPSARTIDDIIKMERAETQAIRNKFGALDGSIIQSFQKINSNDSIKIMVTLKEPEGIYYLDKTKNSQEDLQKQAHDIASIRPIVNVDAFLLRYGFKPNNILSQKSFWMSAHRRDLETIMNDKDVASIDEVGDETPTAYVIPDDIMTLAPSAYSHNGGAVPYPSGQGVNTSTWELGIDYSVFNCFNVFNQLKFNQLDLFTGNMGDPDWQHSQWTFHCLLSAAPGSNPWHRAHESFNRDYNGVSDVNYIVNNGIQTASMSVKRGGTSPYTATFAEFESMDDMAYYYPYPVFCNPTANDGYMYISNWHCYNAISVGNVLHNNLTHFELVDPTVPTGGCTQTKNPVAIHGTINDREMPSIVAPGYAHHDYCVDNASFTFTCGTSFSAPIVNGIAADVISADTRIYAWPEKVRAILLATAEDVDGSYWNYQVDGKDGAGVVYGMNAVYFAQHHLDAYQNGTAVTDGIAASSIYASDFNSPNNDIIYNILIPNTQPSGKHLRVVLTWDSNPVLNSATNALSDLDLFVTDGVQPQLRSASFNSNIEMIDIPNGKYASGTTVQAKVSKYANYIPAGARTNYFYYCIAWTWVSDHAQ